MMPSMDGRMEKTSRKTTTTSFTICNMSNSQGAVGNATPKLWSETPPQYQFSLEKIN
jgi:hypothetical protein